MPTINIHFSASYSSGFVPTATAIAGSTSTIPTNNNTCCETNAIVVAAEEEEDDSHIDLGKETIATQLNKIEVVVPQPSSREYPTSNSTSATTGTGSRKNMEKTVSVSLSSSSMSLLNRRKNKNKNKNASETVDGISSFGGAPSGPNRKNTNVKKIPSFFRRRGNGADVDPATQTASSSSSSASSLPCGTAVVVAVPVADHNDSGMVRGTVDDDTTTPSDAIASSKESNSDNRDDTCSVDNTNSNSNSNSSRNWTTPPSSNNNSPNSSCSTDCGAKNTRRARWSNPRVTTSTTTTSTTSSLSEIPSTVVVSSTTLMTGKYVAPTRSNATSTEDSSIMSGTTGSSVDDDDDDNETAYYSAYDGGMSINSPTNHRNYNSNSNSNSYSNSNQNQSQNNDIISNVSKAKEDTTCIRPNQNTVNSIRSPSNITTGTQVTTTTDAPNNTTVGTNRKKSLYRRLSSSSILKRRIPVTAGSDCAAAAGVVTPPPPALVPASITSSTTSTITTTIPSIRSSTTSIYTNSVNSVTTQLGASFPSSTPLSREQEGKATPTTTRAVDTTVASSLVSNDDFDPIESDRRGILQKHNNVKKIQPQSQAHPRQQQYNNNNKSHNNSNHHHTATEHDDDHINQPDVYGQIHPVETPELVAQAREQFEIELTKLPSDLTVGLHIAYEKCPHLSKYDDNFKLLFLRTDVFKPVSAAKRYAVYWNRRIELFGYERAFLPINYNLLNQGEIDIIHSQNWSIVTPRQRLAAIQQQAQQFQQHQQQVQEQTTTSEELQRCYVFVDYSKFVKKDMSTMDFIRACWYIAHILVEDDIESQRKGLIFIATSRGASVAQLPSMDFVKLFFHYHIGCGPFRLSAYHVMYPPAIIRYLHPLVAVFLIKRIRSRVQVHYDCINPVARLVSKYKIPPHDIPIEIGGTYKIDVPEWLHRQKVKVGIV